MRVSALALMALGGVACGGSSSSGSSGGSVTPPTPIADTTSPSVSFSAAALTVTSGGTGTSTLTATDNVRVTSGPTVSCTNNGSFSGSTFTAPNVSTDTTSICTATAGDAAGNSSSATLTVTITAPVPDTQAPTLSFSPAALSVSSGATATSTLTASDDVGVTTGPTVSCTNGGSFTGSTFTAPAVTMDTTVVCTATASDAAGNAGTADLTVTVSAPAPDTEAPVLSFSPTALSVASGETGASTLTATDNVAVTTGPTVSCTNGGSFSGTTFTAPDVTSNTTIVCTATASDAAGNSGTADLTVTVTAPPAAVTISGKVTFDHVPFTARNTAPNSLNEGLNYNAITQDPAPGLTVEALDSTGVILQSTKTDGSGDYSLSVDPNTDVRLRVKAEMVQTSGAQWDVRVIDNTSSDALYALQGALTNSGSIDSTRDLNAGSGWGGSSYNSTRAAAPFAILAPIYQSIQKVVAADADVIFPPAKFNWSVNNKATNGDIANGEIGTSSYIGNGNILILGDANSDTDEYDKHVVIHEWGHYFEDQLSRSDSIGGSHGGADRLDPRVALGEGFGNALSGMMTDDPFYRDSFNANQGADFDIDVEGNSYTNEGWFNEGSVQSILYDIYDTTDDGADTISAGFGPIYNVLTSTAYKESGYFSTIFTFLDQYRTNNAADVAAVNTLATAQTISGSDAAGTGETNNGSIASALPVYKTVLVDGGPVEVCSVTVAGEYNKLGNRAYLVFDVTSPGTHTLTMTRKSGASTRNPDFTVHRAGTLVGNAFSGTVNSETSSINLTTAGQHVIDAYDDRNNSTANNGDACYDFEITR